MYICYERRSWVMSQPLRSVCSRQRISRGYIVEKKIESYTAPCARGQYLDILAHSDP